MNPKPEQQFLTPECGPEQQCLTPECGHPWRFHSEAVAARCRVTGCGCPSFTETLTPEPVNGLAETLEEAARRVESGAVVIMMRGGPEAIDSVSLAIVRSIIGTPMEGDPDVQFATVEK